jgi:arylsulfatase A-like enzyme
MPTDITGLTNRAFGPFTRLRNSGVMPDLNDSRGMLALPELFKLHGYTTVVTGKVSHNHQTQSDMPGAWSRAYPRPHHYEGQEKQQRASVVKILDLPDSETQEGKIAAEAISELQTLKAESKPFFLGVGFIRPHLPFYAPRKYWDLYDRGRLKLADFQETPSGCNRSISLHESFEMRDQYPQLDVPDAETEARILRHGYNACVSFVDAQIGKILAELDRQGLRENTIVMLWGDHGWHLGDYGIWGKHTCFDWALRSPLIISMPGKGSKGVAQGLVETVDIYPTLAEICGLKTPANLDGKSMLPLINNPKLPGKKYVRGYMAEGFWRENNSLGGRQYKEQPMGYTIRTERYRLVQWRDKKTGQPIDYIELYDHQNDPGETVNIAKENPEVVAELSRFITPVKRSGYRERY